MYSFIAKKVLVPVPDLLTDAVPSATVHGHHSEYLTA